MITKCGLIRKEAAQVAARRPEPVVLGGEVVKQEGLTARPSAPRHMHLPGA